VERLEQIMKNFNQNAGYGVFPMSAKDFYYVLELIQKSLKEGSQNDEKKDEQNNA